MKLFLKTKARRTATTIALAVILGLLIGATPSQAGPCERALNKCLVEAAIAGLVGLVTTGGMSTGILAEFCMAGYAFCLQYCI